MTRSCARDLCLWLEIKLRVRSFDLERSYHKECSIVKITPFIPNRSIRNVDLEKNNEDKLYRYGNKRRGTSASWRNKKAEGHSDTTKEDVAWTYPPGNEYLTNVMEGAIEERRTRGRPRIGMMSELKGRLPQK